MTAPGPRGARSGDEWLPLPDLTRPPDRPPVPAFAPPTSGATSAPGPAPEAPGHRRRLVAVLIVILLAVAALVALLVVNAANRDDDSSGIPTPALVERPGETDVSRVPATDRT